MANLLNRYEITLTDTTSGDKIRSFTWETTRDAAQKRITNQMNRKPETWNGWTFKIGH